MTRINLDELATLVRVFGERVRIAPDGAVSVTPKQKPGVKR